MQAGPQGKQDGGRAPLGQHPGELGALSQKRRPDRFELLVIEAGFAALPVSKEDLPRPEVPDPGKLLVREASNAHGILGGAAEVDLGALGGKLPLNGRQLEDRLRTRHPGIGRAQAPHDLRLTARASGQQGFGDAAADVEDAAFAALEYVLSSVAFTICPHCFGTDRVTT